MYHKHTPLYYALCHFIPMAQTCSIPIFTLFSVGYSRKWLMYRHKKGSVETPLRSG